MSEIWQRTIAYAAVVVVAAFSYYLAQTSINAHEASLPVQQYLDCLNKVGNYDWSGVPEPRPSTSAVCENLTSREKVD